MNWFFEVFKERHQIHGQNYKNSEFLLSGYSLHLCLQWVCRSDLESTNLIFDNIKICANQRKYWRFLFHLSTITWHQRECCRHLIIITINFHNKQQVKIIIKFCCYIAITSAYLIHNYFMFQSLLFVTFRYPKYTIANVSMIIYHLESFCFLSAPGYLFVLQWTTVILSALELSKSPHKFF